MIYWAKFEGKLFSDPKRSGPLLEKVSLNKVSSKVTDANEHSMLLLLKLSSTFMLNNSPFSLISGSVPRFRS